MGLALIPVSGNLSQKQVVSMVRLDYLLHFLTYFSICLYFAIGRFYNLRLFERKSGLKFIGLILFLASFTELVQIVVPSRSFNPVDLVANLTGVGIGLLGYIAADLQGKRVAKP